jgi:hypothetical protein
MISIILKNKKLITFYKYSVKVFKFLNKHLYILSILSFLTKTRNSIFYKIISYTIKLVILINLFISSGLFYASIDLYTPFSNIYSFYDIILSPYLDLIKNKYDKIFDLDISKPGTTDKEILDSKLPTLDESKPSNKEGIKNFLSVIAFLFLLWFVFGVPAPSIDPRELEHYNFINKALFQVKVLIKDLWNIWFNNGGDSGSSGSGNKGSSPDEILFDISPDAGIECGDNRSNSSSSGSTTPTRPSIIDPSSSTGPGTSNPRTQGSNLVDSNNGCSIPNDLQYIEHSKVNKNQQTIINGVTVSKMNEAVKVIQDSLSKSDSDELLDLVNSRIKNITD